MKKQRRQTTEESMEVSTDAAISFAGESDVCQQLLDRYGKSAAPQHRHLCATAAATRSIIQAESLPLIPLSYFAATIDALSDTSRITHDADAVSALSSFLAIVLPLVPEKSIATSKAAEATEIVIELMESPCEGLPVSSVRALVKCLGVLLEFCDLDDWESVKSGFQTLMKYSIDKRPKVRKCAQDCVVKVFKSFQSPVKKRASKLVLKSLKTYMPLAVKTVASRSADESKDDSLSKCEHLEVLHMLNLLKFLVPYLPSKVISKAVVELQKAISVRFSALTRHTFDVMEEILRFLEVGSTIPDIVKIVATLASYISVRQNPVDTIFSASALLVNFLTKFQIGDSNKWNSHYSLVTGSITGLLTSEATATKASIIIKEMINDHIDVDILSSSKMMLADENYVDSKESRILKSLCDMLLKVLSTNRGIPNEHTLAVISVLFLKLGKSSHIYMGSILLKLASFMTVASGNTSDVKHLQECLGSAVIAMGPEKLLEAIPITLDANLTCSNIWLIPILKDYVAGSSLGFFIECIVPLADSFQEACQKVKMSVIREELQAHARGCWELLPAFCRYPHDMHQNFQSLAKLLISCLRKDSFMLETVALALQHLVKQNRSVLSADQGDVEVSKLPKTSYSKKTATRNIKALASCSEELLQAFTKLLVKVPLEKHAFLKDTIECLALITDSSAITKIFLSSLKRLKLNVSVDKVIDDKSSTNKNANRCLILELASSVVGAASLDLIDLIYNFIRQSLQEEDDNIQSESYATLYKILEKSSGFCSSRFEELVELLLGFKSPAYVTSLRWRFSCFRTLLIHSIERTSDGENTHGFRMLNEIIVTLKDSKEESRKVAYDILLGMSSSLQKTSSSPDKGPYYEFISMIMGYLSGSSPHIKSGAVSALSLVIYNDSKICNSMPDLVPSILELLHSKAIEVIKAVLGFLKVLVLSLQVRDLQNFMSDILSGLLPWSSVSRHHFKSKVTVILEIIMRKCGSASVKSLVPEKYRDFVKNVLENRQGKTSSQEAVTTKTEAENSDTTPKSRQKKIPKAAGSITSNNNERSTEPRKRKRDDKRSSYKPRKFAPAGNTVDRKKEVKHSGKRKIANFKSDNSGGKRRKQWTKKNTRV
ncbi:RRP12-like protein isoform X1 [Cynara cardunculus var. scolymus]|uniref:RRP12-like protein isoform X1 n=1 Tax=Cynara cardunculus var. scolymus TaxID=59895 RepID=UPI000D62B376|nr:RRP12-like protein isoform X1 [Cynara cardunculus var. scolymus]